MAVVPSPTGSRPFNGAKRVQPLGRLAVLGVLNGLIHTRLKVPSFIVTLGMWYVGLGIATLLFGTEAIPFITNDALKLWPGGIVLGLPRSFWLALVLVLLGAALARYTRLGRSAYAIGNNEHIARDNGVAVGRRSSCGRIGAAAGSVTC